MSWTNEKPGYISVLQDLWSLNDEIAAQREALAGDQAQYGAQSEYGAASAPIGGEILTKYFTRILTKNYILVSIIMKKQIDI